MALSNNQKLMNYIGLNDQKANKLKNSVIESRFLGVRFHCSIKNYFYALSYQ